MIKSKLEFLSGISKVNTKSANLFNLALKPQNPLDKVKCVTQPCQTQLKFILQAACFLQEFLDVSSGYAFVWFSCRKVVLFHDRIPVTETEKLALLLVSPTSGIMDWWFVFTLSLTLTVTYAVWTLPSFSVWWGTHTSISFALGADFLIIVAESYTKLRADIVTPAFSLPGVSEVGSSWCNFSLNFPRYLTINSSLWTRGFDRLWLYNFWFWLLSSLHHVLSIVDSCSSHRGLKMVVD